MSKHLTQNQEIQQNNKPQAIVIHQNSLTTFSGPLPHPDILKKYEEVIPGAALRILKIAEDQAAHRKELEQIVISSDVERSKWGQILGFIISIIGVTSSTAICIWGNAWAGTIIGAGTIASLVSVFMYGSKARLDERSQNKEPRLEDK